MNPEIKKLWVEALRSGLYQQGKRQLRRGTNEGDRYCCLGVLCDLHAKATGGVWKEPHSAGDWWRYGEGGAYLPASVQEWAGLSEGDPRVVFDTSLGGNRTLSENNDGCYAAARSFDGIADLIERAL